VIILGNHGLVVAGDTVTETESLLDAVVDRLKHAVRDFTAPLRPHLERLARDTDYIIPEDDGLHGTATDPISLSAAMGGSLYPDHVIFLGPGIVALEDGETVGEAVRRAARPTLPLLLVPGAGALMHKSATAATQALARCLADVTARLDADAPLTYIGAANEAALLDWDAEKYRQSLDKAAP
jgi:rhamnose utilization protein RhaD (predicted bifunctional aldolase and dehydrogenase)